MPTGRVRDAPCRRCIKAGRECLERAGKGIRACVFCATIKMRCDVDDMDPAPAKPADTSSRKAAPGVMSSDDEYTTPAPVKRSRAPARKRPAQPKRTPAPATAEPVPTTPEPAPAPAPDSLLARIKAKIKGKAKAVSPPISPSSESEDGYMKPRPPARPTFRELEEQSGTPVFFLLYIFAYSSEKMTVT